MKEKRINVVLRHSLNIEDHSPKINMVREQLCDVVLNRKGRGVDESLQEVMTPEKGHDTIIHNWKEVLVIIFGADPASRPAFAVLFGEGGWRSSVFLGVQDPLAPQVNATPSGHEENVDHVNSVVVCSPVVVG